MRFIIIKTTFAKKKEAEEVSNKIISNKLGACVQISKIESYYKWNNKIEKSDEYKVEIKTTNKNYKKIEEIIVKNHKYEIPEIIVHNLPNGSKRYLNWLKNEVI
jgi:periplasmic divalent cation tolerance protein